MPETSLQTRQSYVLLWTDGYNIDDNTLQKAYRRLLCLYFIELF